MRLAFKQNRVKIADINAQIEDNLSGIRVVKSFANEEIENRKFKQGNDSFLAAKKNSYFYMGSYQAGLGAFTTLIQVSVILTGTVLIAKGSVDVSDLVTFMLYISVFTDPVRTLIDSQSSSRTVIPDLSVFRRFSPSVRILRTKKMQWNLRM